MPRPIASPLRSVLRRVSALGSWFVGRCSHAFGATSGRLIHEPRTTKHEQRVRGFTLIELIIVVAIIGILATIAVPAMRTAPQRAREAALRENLFTMRSCIDQFHADRGRYPASLEELVSLGYLRSLPFDPITRSADTWVAEYPEVTEEETEREQEESVGLIDVRSGAEGAALDGTLYADW